MTRDDTRQLLDRIERIIAASKQARGDVNATSWSTRAGLSKNALGNFIRLARGGNARGMDYETRKRLAEAVGFPVSAFTLQLDEDGFGLLVKIFRDAGARFAADSGNAGMLTADEHAGVLSTPPGTGKTAEIIEKFQKYMEAAERIDASHIVPLNGKQDFDQTALAFLIMVSRQVESQLEERPKEEDLASAIFRTHDWFISEMKSGRHHPLDAVVNTFRHML